jgi:hypothetical protein
MNAKWFSCTLINVHAPTNKKMEEVKEEFDNLLQQNMPVPVAAWSMA